MPERLAYDTAMQFAPIRLKIQDPEIKQGSVEMVTTNTAAGPVERPWGIEGGFAVVYKFRTKSGMVRALRCFRVPMSSDIQYRYERIGAYFHAHASEITTNFTYHHSGIVVKEQGIVPDQVYPLIEMDWIDGVTLVEKIHELCLKRDRSGLQHLTDQWIKILLTMHDHQIAHGDLSGVNVMVQADGKMLLIDYDSVYIPELANYPQVLLGQEDFQHPQMAQRGFDQYMDNFSALVIYTALMALIVQPELWNNYAKIDSTGKLLDVNILFKQQDFQAPEHSPLFVEIEHIQDWPLQTAVQALKRACLQSVDEVRFPLALIDPDYKQRLALQQLQVAFAEAFHCNDDQSIFAAAIALQQSPYQASFLLTEKERQRIGHARNHIEALAQFRFALKSRIPAQIVAVYRPILDTSPYVDVAERKQLALARLCIEALDSDDDDALIAAQTALQQSPWQDCFFFTSQEQQRIKLAMQRARALATFHNALIAYPRHAHKIIAAYNASLLDGSTSVTQRQRDLIEAARCYLTMYQKVQQGLQDDDLAMIQSAYHSTLGEQFSDFSSAEQQRIESAMLSQELEALLAQKEYGPALKKAQQIQIITGQTIHDSLTFKLQLAVKRLIRNQELTDFTVAIAARAEHDDAHNDAIVRWQWPQDELVQQALIVWRSDTWPDRLVERCQQDPACHFAWPRRKDNTRHGEWTFSIQQQTQVYVRGYAALCDTWHQEYIWRFSDGVGSRSDQPHVIGGYNHAF